MREGINRIVRHLFISRLEEIPFIVFLSFLITFIVSRAYVYITSHDILEYKYLIDNIYINGIHVHHLNWGIFILVIVGFIALYDIQPLIHRRLAIFYGIGLGLTFDEFALWLKLEDDYYARISYEAIIIISLILLNIIYFPDFWRKRGSQVKSTLLFVIGIIKRPFQ
ncbi:MAG: hypothetical protein M3Q44_03165 [bacterium]|nr:hypothetical protein [bacterium]